MCQAIMSGVAATGRMCKILFSDVQAQLPLLTRNATPRWVTWGRRLHESGDLPAGGTLLQSALQLPEWQVLFPKPVKIMATGFLLRDLEDRIRYYPLVKDQLLQGVWVRQGPEVRVYLLMQPVIGVNALHTQWPRVLCHGAQL